MLISSQKEIVNFITLRILSQVGFGTIFPLELQLRKHLHVSLKLKSSYTILPFPGRTSLHFSLISYSLKKIVFSLYNQSQHENHRCGHLCFCAKGRSNATHFSMRLSFSYKKGAFKILTALEVWRPRGVEAFV